MRVLVQFATNPSEKRRLSIFNQQVQELLKSLNMTINAGTVSEADMTLTILQASKPIKLTYDSDTNKAISPRHY